MSSNQRWAVVETDAGEVHIVPWLVQQDEPAGGHQPRQLCPVCQPIRLIGGSGGPLDEPTYSHQQPDWPGNVVTRPQT